MVQLSDLMTANATGGAVRDVPILERMQMTALDVVRHTMHRALAVNNWERAAVWAVQLLPYEERPLAPFAAADHDDDRDDQQHCRAN